MNDERTIHVNKEGRKERKTVLIDLHVYTKEREWFKLVQMMMMSVKVSQPRFDEYE